MKYYGNMDFNRLDMMDCIDMDTINNPNTPEGYLYSKGMLFEFLANRDTSTIRKRYYKGEYPPVEYLDCSEFKKRKYRKQTYFMGVVKTGKDEERFILYRQLPRIANDNTFRWRNNERYGTKETVIIQGNFEFTCIVKETGDAVVDVRYTKCDNKHRNRVTITRIEVYNASNEEILKAIAEWKEVFKEEMSSDDRTVRDFRLVV